MIPSCRIHCTGSGGTVRTMSDSKGASEWRAPPPPRLGARSVHVWRALNGASDIDAIVSELSSEEQARALRFARESDRRAYVVAHGVLRRVLSGYTAIAPGDLEFDVGAHGKPSLRSDALNGRLSFNLSHSGEMALVAVSSCESVGVDVERQDSRADLLRLAREFFSPREQEALQVHVRAGEDVAETFFRAWTRKEAYLKATGQGVVSGLSHFDMPLQSGEQLTDRFDSAAARRWHIVDLSPGAGYSASLVAAAPVAEVVLLDVADAISGDLEANGPSYLVERVLPLRTT